MGLLATLGAGREAFAGSLLDDWRIGPLIVVVYTLFAWLLNN